MTKIVELRPDKNLMNTHFEKYQFTSDVAPVITKIDLTTGVRRLEVNANQQSWLEARLFAYHNHLFKNPFDTSCWFVDDQLAVWRLKKDGGLTAVHTMHTTAAEQTAALYNPSIGFTFNRIAVLSDGNTKLELLMEDESESMKCFQLNKAEPGIIMDVQCVQTQCVIVVTMCSIMDDSEKKYTHLVLLFYAWKNPGDTSECFELVKRQVLKVHGTVEYTFLENNGDFLHTISQDIVIFDGPPLDNAEDKNETIDDTHIKIPKYSWSQDEDSLTVWINIPEKHHEEHVKVNVLPTSLSISINSDILIEGECQHRLEEKLATWKQEGDTLCLELVKYEAGLMWSELIKNDTEGKCVPNEALATEIHNRLTHLCTDRPDGNGEGQPCLGFNADQLEECDVEGRDNRLQRLNLTTRETTHLAMLGASNHVLFTYKTKSDQVVCLRHDHDACIWLMGSLKNEEWNIKHTSTFPGFGYVEASKTNKKFCVCSISSSYVAIVEHTQHIFIYEKPENGQQVGRQWIVDLGCETTPIMGAVATAKYLIILTKDALYCLQITQ